MTDLSGSTTHKYGDLAMESTTLETSSVPSSHSLTIKAAESLEEKLSDEQGVALFSKAIVLNPGISTINYYASLIHVMAVQFSHTVTYTLQPLILLDRDSYNVDKAHIGSVLTGLMLVQTLTKICLTPIYGFLIDKFGRKVMTMVGAFAVLIGYLMVPFQTSVFPGYAISKALVTNGGNILTLVPLTADYIHNSTKGKAVGISMALGTSGQLMGSLFITFLLGMKVSLVTIHVLAGLAIFGLVSINAMGIKGGRYYTSKDSDKKEENFFAKLKLASKALKKNGWLMISLTLSTLIRADYYLVTIVFAVFVRSFDQDTTQIDQSNRLINTYQDLYFMLSLLGNIAYGFVLDKVNTLKVIFPMLTIAIIGYTCGIFADSPESVLLLLMIFFAGVSMPGLLSSANYLAFKNYPADLRGVLSSVVSMIGIVGYLFLSIVGNYLFDHAASWTPFLLFVAMLGISMLFIGIISYVKFYSIKREEVVELKNAQLEEADTLE